MQVLKFLYSKKIQKLGNFLFAIFFGWNIETQVNGQFNLPLEYFLQDRNKVGEGGTLSLHLHSIIISFDRNKGSVLKLYICISDESKKGQCSIMVLVV